MLTAVSMRFELFIATRYLRAKRRQAVVLKRMTEEGFITSQQASQAVGQPLSFRPLARDDLAPYFVERVRQRLVAEYGETMVYKGGLQVYTTLS